MSEQKSRDGRGEWGHPLVAFAVTLAFYLATLFPGVGGVVNRGDSSKFQFLGVIGGVSHPPGNPLYLVVLWFAEHACWFARPWWVASALSAVLGAAAVALIYDGVRRATGVLGGSVAALALATGPLFWTLSTEAEVYTLNAALLALCVWGLIRWQLTPRPRFLVVALGAFVLCFANHVTVVAALPAFVACALRVHQERGIPRVLWGVGALGVVVVVGLYLYPPLRAGAAPYSELSARFTQRQLLAYYTAVQSQGSFSVPTADAMFTSRLPEVARRLQEQWLWPVLLVLGAGILRAWRGFPGVVSFAVGGVAGFVAFAALYDIPDPEGFYIPIVTLLSPFAGFAIGSLAAANPTRRALIVLGVAAVSLFASFATRIEDHRRETGFEIVDTMGNEPPILWDLPDLVERLPDSAAFVLPCSHYGCVEIFNYFRFADPTVRRKKLRFVTLRGGAASYELPSPPVQLSPADAQRVPVCSIVEHDRRLLAAAGARVRRIDRPDRAVGPRTFVGVPIFCSEP